MRSYSRSWMLGLNLILPFLPLTAPAVAAAALASAEANPTFDLPATLHEGAAADSGALPSSLPVDGEDPVPFSTTATPARKSADASSKVRTPVPTVNDPAIDSAATLAPEASTEIPADPSGSEISTPPSTLSDAAPSAESVLPEAGEDRPRAAPAKTRSASTSRRLGGLYRPYYDAKPTVALQFIGSRQALGDRFAFQDDPYNAEYNVAGFSLGLELQPKFLQHFGLISVGPSVSVYPFSITDKNSPAQDATDRNTDVKAFGAAAKYQFYYLRGQVFVPFLGYEMQFARYKFKDAADGTGSGSTTLSGPVFGAMLQLQWLEHTAAFDAFQDWGIARSYLVFESKKLTSNEGVLDTHGSSYWFGLRMEM